MNILLLRHKTGHQGTPGTLVVPEKNWTRPVLELPWRDNRQNLSCVPAGNYVCRRRRSPRFGETFMLYDVPGRSYVLFHGGNFAGASDKGWRTHSHGCLLIGSYVGVLQNQRAVLASRFAFSDFMEIMDGINEFDLKIMEAS